jgi:hypothetical protein
MALLGGTKRVPTPRPLLNLLATDPEALIVLTADETMVEVGGVEYVGGRWQGAAE